MIRANRVIESLRSLLNQGLVHTRVWRRFQKCPFPGFFSFFLQFFEGSRANSKPAPNPGTRQFETPVETPSEIRANRKSERFARIGLTRYKKGGASIANDSRESIRANRVANRPCH